MERERIAIKGSQRRPNPRLIADAIEGVGGILDAYTSFESTVYYAKVADIHFDRALDVLADMLLAPCLDAKDIEKERRVIAEDASIDNRASEMCDRHERYVVRQASKPHGRIAGTRVGADDGGRRGADRLGGSAAPVATPVVININIIRIRSGDRND